MSRDTLCISNLPIQFSLTPYTVHQTGQISIANIKTQPDVHMPETASPYVAQVGHSQFYEYLVGGAQFQISSTTVDWSLLLAMVMIQLLSLVYSSGLYPGAQPSRLAR